MTDSAGRSSCGAGDSAPHFEPGGAGRRAPVRSLRGCDPRSDHWLESSSAARPGACSGCAPATSAVASARANEEDSMSDTDRSDRRRPRRAGRGLHPGGARLPRDPVRGATPGSAARRRCLRAGLPLRHGTDDPDRAAGAAADLRRGRARRSSDELDLSGSIRSGAASSRTARCSTWSRTSTRWPRRSTSSRPARATGDGYRDFIALSEQLHEISERFFFWKSVEDIKDTLDLKAQPEPLARCAT